MKQDDVKCSRLFDLTKSIAGPFLERFDYPWDVLPHIEEIILKIGGSLPKDEYYLFGGHSDIWVHKSARIAATASITGPAIIGRNAEIRQCAFIRGRALVGDGAVIGNSTELKNVIVFEKAELPHYNYVGDSIIGFHGHMGAGSITSNVRADRQPVVIHLENEDITTGMKKIGAMLGDYAEVGCGAVLNPGTVIGRNAIVYPLSMVRGCVDEDHILKTGGVLAKRQLL